MARTRWDRNRQRRARWAALPPEALASPILRRIVVIDREIAVREAIIFAGDSAREARRKLRDVLRPLPALPAQQAASSPAPLTRPAPRP